MNSIAIRQPFNFTQTSDPITNSSVGSWADAVNRKLNSHDNKLASNTEIICDQSNQLNQIDSKVNQIDSKTNHQNNKIIIQNNKIDSQGDLISNLEHTIKEQVIKIEQQEVKIEQQAVKIEQQAVKIEQQATEIKELKVDNNDLRTQVNQLQSDKERQNALILGSEFIKTYQIMTREQQDLPLNGDCYPFYTQDEQDVCKLLTGDRNGSFHGDDLKTNYTLDNANELKSIILLQLQHSYRSQKRQRRQFQQINVPYSQLQNMTEIMFEKVVNDCQQTNATCLLY